MTIQEAIKSGKRFRRKGESEWLSLLVEGLLVGPDWPSGCCGYLDKEALLADDWEVQSEPKEVWANVCQYEGTSTEFIYSLHKSEEQALANIPHVGGTYLRTIKLREVIE